MLRSPAGWIAHPNQLDPIEHAVLLIGTVRADVAGRKCRFGSSINEAVSLAKRFGGTDGHKFVNAVLDRAAASLRPHEH